MLEIRPNFYSYFGYGSKNDIRMSVTDYVDLVNALREDNISTGTSLKFK